MARERDPESEQATNRSGAPGTGPRALRAGRVIVDGQRRLSLPPMAGSTLPMSNR
jgi:hypothetical protein